MPEMSGIDRKPYQNEIVAFGGLEYPFYEETNYGAWDEPAPAPRFDPSQWKTLSNAGSSAGDLINSFYRKQNAFTQTNTIESEIIQVRETISQLEAQLVVSYRSILVKALLELFGYAMEENPGRAGISIGSLRSFCNFLQLYPRLKCPDVSLTPDNDIYASWTLARHELFSARFLSSNVVDWVVFTRNKLNPEMIDRGSGTTLTSTLMQTIQPYGVSHWVYDERG